MSLYVKHITNKEIHTTALFSVIGTIYSSLWKDLNTYKLLPEINAKMYIEGTRYLLQTNTS